MAINPKILRELPQKQRTYWTKAQEFLTKNGQDWEMVDAHTPEYHAWIRYFRRKGFKPHMLSLVEKRVIDKIAVPAKTPEWFDMAYVDSGDLPAFPTSSATIMPSEMLVKPGQINWPQYLSYCNKNGKEARPIGAFEHGGYLSGSKPRKAEGDKKRLATEARKRLEDEYGIDLVDNIPDAKGKSHGIY